MSSNHDQFVDEQLRITCARIAEAVELAKRGASRDDEAAWLLACNDREAGALVAPTSWPISRMGLSDTEQRALWALIAQELSPSARMNLRDLATEDDVDVSLDVHRRVVYGSLPAVHVWGELAVTGRLRSTCLISAVEGDGMPAHRIAFRVTPRVLALVHGVIAIDDELAGIVVQTQVIRSLDELVVNPHVRDQTCEALDRPTGLTIVSGLGASGRRSLLAAAAREIGVEVLTIDARRISQERARADRELRIVARECQLLDRVPLLINLEALLGTSDVDDRLDLIEKVFTGRVLATTSRPVARRWTAPPTLIELPTLSGAERAELWSRALPEASRGDADLLSTIYPLAPALIDAVGRVAIEHARGAALEAKHVSVGIRTVLDDRLAGLATRVAVTQKWEDLVLPEDQTLAVVELLARIRARRRVYEDWGFAEKLSKGLGVTALFSGPPGTGKSMCAGLIAKDLGTEIYQVDLGKIVSKWIGETEKNLAALFDAAEAGHAVLLFDEADSLFGKRTAVKSSKRSVREPGDQLPPAADRDVRRHLHPHDEPRSCDRRSVSSPYRGPRSVSAPRRGRTRSVVACDAAGERAGRRRPRARRACTQVHDGRRQYSQRGPASRVPRRRCERAHRQLPPAASCPARVRGNGKAGGAARLTECRKRDPLRADRPRSRRRSG